MSGEYVSTIYTMLYPLNKKYMSGRILKKLRNKVVKEVEKECKDLINLKHLINVTILVNTTM